MLSILLLLIGTLWDLSAANSMGEEHCVFVMCNGVRTLSPDAIERWKEGYVPKRHKGAFVDRKDLRSRISVFFEAYPTPYCYTNDATVEVLREFSQKSDKEVTSCGLGYIAAIEASFDNLLKLQSAGKVAKDLNCKDVFSEEERKGLLHYSYAIENPGQKQKPALTTLELMQYNDPWSSAILQMGLGTEFPAPTEQNPICGRAAARLVAANVVYDMTCEKTTDVRVQAVMQKYNHSFAVIPIKNPNITKEELAQVYSVPTHEGFKPGCLTLPTKGQLIFQYPINDEEFEMKPKQFCALVPTFGFVWGGPGHGCKEEGGYDVGSFCDMLFGGPSKRKNSKSLFTENLRLDKVTNLQEPPKEGYDRFLFWHTYTAGYGMGLLADERVELPTQQGQTKATVRLGVFFCGFMQASYYEQDQAGPGKNYLIFRNVTLDFIEGRFDSDGKREFFIIERKVS